MNGVCKHSYTKHISVIMAKELVKYNIDVAALCEARLAEYDNIQTKVTLLSGVAEEKMNADKQKIGLE